jgi:undecaprenyl-diphosphatase
VLQLATALAVLVYFWKDLRAVVSRSSAMLWALVAGTVPAVLAGLFFESYLDTALRSGHVVAWALIAGSVLFFAAERYAAWLVRKRASATTPGGLTDAPAVVSPGVSVKRGFIVGCFQVLAFIPGMSRSGSTISGGLFAGLTRDQAIRFSFLLSFPILFGSGLKKMLDLSTGGLIDAPLIVGSVVAFLVGLASIHFLIVYLRTHTLNVFIVYRIVLAILVLLFI